MNLNPIGGFESHKVVHSAGSRARDRQHSHRRAVETLARESRQEESDGGVVGRLLSRWGQRARIEIEPVARSAQQTLTDTLCVLNDGTPGRIALRRVDDSWVEICVPA